MGASRAPVTYQTPQNLDEHKGAAGPGANRRGVARATSSGGPAHARPVPPAGGDWSRDRDVAGGVRGGGRGRPRPHPARARGAHRQRGGARRGRALARRRRPGPARPLRGHPAHRARRVVGGGVAARPDHDLPEPDAADVRLPRRGGRGGRRHGHPRGRAPLRDRRRAAPRARLGLTPVPRPEGAILGGMDKVIKTEQEWRAELDPMEYAVLREAATERPYTGELLGETRTGIFSCRACGAELFRSETKFESHCGWPSFYQPQEGDAVELVEDRSHGMIRTEVRCARCGSHLGHLFDDAPQTPTGDRYCINSVALRFAPEG